MSWFSGYGGQPTSSLDESNISFLKGINGYVRESGIEGNGAVDAYNKFARTGASDAEKTAFARRLAAQFGR